jgi:bifunctional non-homologous end joining protein LigD
VTPKLAVEVDFRGWTGAKRVRQAAFKGLREDKPAKEIVRETAMPAAKVKAKSSKAAKSPAKKAPAKKPRKASAPTDEVQFTNPDRIYWTDVEITKKDLADYYREVWDHMAPHVIRRPMALVRCPSGVGTQCFFQKHAAAGLIDERIRRIKDQEGEELIYIDDLDGMLQMVQAGTLEVHVWGSTVDDIESANRMVFDFDPGDGVSWPDMMHAVRELRERLQALKLESFLKTTGGKGLHVVVPFAGADWDTTKAFTHAMVQMMEADDPKRYVTKMTKSLRKGKIFLDYLRNGRGATAIVAYSTRSRPGATVSMPIGWEELNGRMAPNKFTVMNAAQRLARVKKDPWADIERVGKKQKLPAAAFGKRK